MEVTVLHEKYCNAIATFVFSENMIFYIFWSKYQESVPRYFFRPSIEYRYRSAFKKYRAHLWPS